MLLLAASYYFYMCWRPEFIVLIMASTLVDYAAGLRIGSSTRPLTRKLWLALSLFVNLGLLFTYKYANFFSDAIRPIFAQFNIFYSSPAFDLLLPVGISFYTFQTLSYTIDVYRGQKEPEHHLGIFALYVSFFPQLVAGPIERSSQLLPQFKQTHSFDYDRVTSGLRLILVGFFKKLVVADRLAIIVNQIYAPGFDASGGVILLGSVFFAFQIYCDFSGYSDIAIGTARILGYDLMTNFRQPYFSSSVSEFWRRWHISLSTWFRDYVYIPLGGSRCNVRCVSRNILVVFVVSGLWHGANWTFIIWGAIHGSMVLMEYLFRRRGRNVSHQIFGNRGISILIHLSCRVGTLMVVCLAWVFFRAVDLNQALEYVTRLLRFICVEFPLGMWPDGSAWMSLGVKDLAMSIFAIGALLMMDTALARGWHVRIIKASVWVRWPCYYALLFAILLFGVFDNTQFIYF